MHTHAITTHHRYQTDADTATPASPLKSGGTEGEANADIAPYGLSQAISQDSNAVFPVVIIGAGLAGLTAAAHLAERGITPLVIDSDWLWPGGRLSGGDVDIITHQGRDWAFKPEHGVHAVWGGYGNLRATLTRFTDTRLVPSPGEEWINRWGRDVRMIEAGNAVRSRWIPAPFHYLQLLFHPHIWANINPLDFLSLPGFLVSLLLTVGFDPIKEQRALDGLRMKEYFRGWTPNLKATFRGLGANLLAAHEDDIDLSAFVAALRFYTMMRRDAWQMHYFPADSHTALIQPLIDAIDARGGQYWGGLTAKQIHHNGDHWHIVVEDALRQGYRTVQAAHIVLATHAPGAKRLLLNSPYTAERAQAIIFPDAVRNVVVRLWFDAAPREGTPGGMLTGDFVPDNFFWLHRLYDDFHRWHVETGGSAIELHLYGNDALLDQNDAHLLIVATTEVYRAFPELRGHFLHGTVRRNSKLHTRWRVPTADSLHVETPFVNMSACGDWIGYDTPSLWMERAATTGIAAANRVLMAYQQSPFMIEKPKQAEALARLLGALVAGGRRLTAPLFRRRKA